MLGSSSIPTWPCHGRACGLMMSQRTLARSPVGTGTAIGTRSGSVTGAVLVVRMLRLSERFAGAVGSRQHLGVDEAIVEMALHGDRLAFRHQLAAFAARTSVNQRASTVVLDDEFVAEHFGNLTLDRDGRAVLQLCDRSRLQ